MEQFEVVVKSTVLISTHGAGEINMMMMYPRYTILLDLCPFYLHCSWRGEGEHNYVCPGWFQNRLSSWNIQGFALEIKDHSCDVVENKMVAIAAKKECVGLLWGKQNYVLFMDYGLSRNVDTVYHAAHVSQSVDDHLMYIFECVSDYENALKK
eukprot:937322_1